MGLFAMKYKIKNRWINTGRVDEYGDDILVVNPDPTVVVLAGRWSQRASLNDRHVEHELFAVSSKRFREMTGIVVYGGNIGARGIIKTHVNDDVHRLIMERAGQKRRRSNRKTRDDVMKTPQEIRRLKAIRDGKPLVRTDVKPIRRRKKA